MAVEHEQEHNMQINDTQTGIQLAIKWLRKTGRSILAAKMERELASPELPLLERNT